MVLRVSKTEKIPADMILLKAVGSSHNCCYLDTTNIDGEMNLKRKNMVVDLSSHQGDQGDYD